MNDIYVSVSEINSFLNCRRAWDFTSNNRQSLRHKITPKLYFSIGSGVHAAIEAQAKGLDPYQALDDFMESERATREENYTETVGIRPWEREWEEFNEAVDFTQQLVIQYFDRWGTNTLEESGLKYLAVEIPFKVPLITTSYGTVYFVGTVDGVATDLATESRYYLVENKTYGSKPDYDLLSRTNQFKAYCWVFRVLTGKSPRGILFNGIAKKLIEQPKVLKNGRLSQNKTASVTLRSFEKAVLEHGHDPELYLDYMEFLNEREASDTRFFHRNLIPYTDVQLDNWYQYVLEQVVPEMVSHPRIYPNFSNCRDCIVRDLCDSLEYGEDIGEVIEKRYKEGSYGTMASVKGVEPKECSTIEEFIQLTGNTNG